MTWRTPEDHARETGAERREIVGKIRRALVSLTDGSVWQFLGALVGAARETFAAETWQGVGFASRPRENARAEALLVYVGKGARQVQAVALRDEELRQLAAADLQPNETAIFNSQSLIVIRVNGDIEARSLGGTAKKLAYQDDLDTLCDYIQTQLTLPVSAGVAGPVATPPCPGAAPDHFSGTSVLKAE